MPTNANRQMEYDGKSGVVECLDIFDERGNVAGGYVEGTGMHIDWQDGPAGPERRFTGSTVDDALLGVKHRIESYQMTKYAHPANAAALHHVTEAIYALNGREKERQDAGVIGTEELDPPRSQPAAPAFGSSPADINRARAKEYRRQAQYLRDKADRLDPPAPEDEDVDAVVDRRGVIG